MVESENMASDVVVDEGGHHTTKKVIHAVVRGIVGGVEQLARGIFSIIATGRRQTLPNITNCILLVPATTLAEKIRTGEWKSVDVVKAYIARIREINPIINAVVDRRFQEALEDAHKVDLFIESGTKSPKQLASETPFLGVPFSSKEAVLVKGLSATCGMVCRRGMTADSDSEAVERLRKAGAIPLVVTNTSEICMFWESYNKLHGKTNNPYDTTKTAGGSSGGEAALLGAAGSVMGLGTDLGGSIRLPSFFCGVFGHKPSNGIVPTGGQFPPVKEQVSPFAVTGPMARFASDLRHMLKVLVGDDLASQMKLDVQVNFESIKVYYMVNDGGNPIATPVSSEMRDCFKNVIFWLKNRGIRTEAVKLGHFNYGLFMWIRYLAQITDQTIVGLMSGEVKTKEEMLPPHAEMVNWLSGKSDYTFPLILNACLQEYLGPGFVRVTHIFQKMSEKLKIQMQEMLGEDGIFLYPSFPTTAPFHGEIFINPMNLNYNVVFNALGFPVTQCSVGLESSGLPVGLQVVANPMNDRLTLTFAEEIEKQFGGWVNPSQM